MTPIIILLVLILIGILSANFWLMAIFCYIYNRDKNAQLIPLRESEIK
jgi:hypothetical protein